MLTIIYTGLLSFIEFGEVFIPQQESFLYEETYVKLKNKVIFIFRVIGIINFAKPFLNFKDDTMI